MFLNDKCYYEHHLLEKWWYLVHDKHTFWNGGVTKLVVDNTPITWKKKTICSNKKVNVNENEHKHRENVGKKVDQ